jgi:hypothetical protein
MVGEKERNKKEKEIGSTQFEINRVENADRKDIVGRWLFEVNRDGHTRTTTMGRKMFKKEILGRNNSHH